MKFNLPPIIYLILWLPFCSPAMKDYAPITADTLLEPWRWRHEEVLEGLGVLCMDEASDGSLWFGNTGSIAHYDGVTVTQITFDEPLLSEIKHHKAIPWASALTVLPDGSPLVLVGESLVLRTNNEWKVIIRNVGTSVFTAQMQQAQDGTIWLMVPDFLWRISSDLSDASIVKEATKTGFLGSFCLDSSDRLWVAEKPNPHQARLVQIPVENGLQKPESDWREYPVPFTTDAKEIWIATGQDGLIRYADDSTDTSLAVFNPNDNEWVKGLETFPKMRFFSLSNGRDGTFWYGAEKEILRIKPGGDPVLYSSNQLQLPQVPLTLFETSRRLWVIGRIGYVYSVDIGTREWKTFEKLNFQCETADGKQWFRAKSRDWVVVHDPRSGKWKRYDLSDGLIDTINTIKTSSHSLIWAAGSHKGHAAIAVFDGKIWTRLEHPEFAAFIESRAVMEAADRTMWFGAGGPQSKEQPQAGGALQYGVDRNGYPYLIKHHAPPAFPYYVTALAQAPDRTIEIGSTVFHRYDESSQSAEQERELQGLNTIDLVYDDEQTLWLAKEHAGVYRQLADSSWKLYTTRDGLAGVDLSDLLLLSDGTLLASSEGGISRFDGKTWTTHAYPKWWAMSDRWSGMHESSDGSVWFNFTLREAQSAQAVVNRTERFKTVRYRAEKTPPDTRITDYLERVAQPGNTHIKWSAHDPWSSTPREALQYSWRLDGGDWSSFSHETSRTFLKLKNGRHQLEVRARDRAFNIDPSPDRIEFGVIPPIWQQGWFIALLSVLTGSIALLIRIVIRNRERYLLNRQAEREDFLVRQQAEREEHLKEIDRIKTGFFTNISHELRTPLTVISGRLETMLNEEADEHRKSTLSIVLRNARRLSTLVTQLLDFRKIEEGKLTVNFTQGDLIPLLQDWVSSLQVLAEKSKITCSLTGVTECYGQFDFDKLQKIFTNLISNSIKYTEAGGEVFVKLEIKENTPNTRQLHFSVEDTGVGIEPEHLGHIFDRFYRVSETSTALGTGVGLNLAKELVDLLGGDIRAESPIHKNPDRPGTRFTVLLPFNTVMQTEEDLSLSQKDEKIGGTEERSVPVPVRDKKSLTDSPLILVVEDDEDIRNFIIDSLEPAYRVETAENGEVGLKKSKEQIPDLIVTDLNMPVMDGIEMCSQLKTSMETSHIPVVMLTAKASPEHQMEGLKTGADDYVTKPFHTELLQVRIANLLESRRLLREKFAQEFSVSTPKIPENSPEHEFLEKAQNVLENHYGDLDFKTDQFAAALNMSLRSLQRKFKAVLDRTPKEFLNEFRMARAAELLISTSETVAEISFNVGMDEPTNFTRLFKAHFKMTPTQYRARQKQSV